MSRYTYVGEFKNPATFFEVQQNPDDGLFYIMVRDERPCDCGCPNCKGIITTRRAHTMHDNTPGFEEYEEAEDHIQGISDFFEEDYDQYLEENRYEIRQQELYEQWRNEY